MFSYRRKGPALTLVLATPFFTELLSGSTPFPIFLVPRIFLILVLLYGFPALVIRELMVRWTPGLPQLFFLGLAYGFYNEGVVAKTLLRSENVPLSAFDHYDFLGINLGWTFLIVPWQAFNGIIFPIAIISGLFPSDRSVVWLTTSGLAIISLICAAVGTSFYFLTQPGRPTGYFFLFWALILGLICLAGLPPGSDSTLLENRDEERGYCLPTLAGLLFYLVLIVPQCFMATLKLPVLMLCLWATSTVCVFYQFLANSSLLSFRTLAFFAVGNYLTASLFRFATSYLSGSPSGMVTAISFTTGCGIFLFVLARPARYIQ